MKKILIIKFTTKYILTTQHKVSICIWLKKYPFFKIFNFIKFVVFTKHDKAKCFV